MSNKEERNLSYSKAGAPMITVKCKVNGSDVCETVEARMTLLQFLHRSLNLFGAKEGCGEGECGACTVIMNGRTVNSCLVLAAEADGAEILTVEGLSKNGELSILQQEFLEVDALQCGFCTPGILMTARSLLDRNPDPSDDEIKVALAGNYCRCTGYYPIIEAIKRTAVREREELKNGQN